VSSSDFLAQFRNALRHWWPQTSERRGWAAASIELAQVLWGFMRDSTPERRRSRYGDMEYDWEHHVNTTSGTVGWRARLLGVFNSPYQPTDPALFREMMASLPIDFSEFTFVDLGSGKGRTLLMASEYRFRRIVGVEILPELHRAAEENIRAYKSATQQCRQIESVCADASEFSLPNEPLVLYLFNPLPAASLRHVIGVLAPRKHQGAAPLWVVYHNPLLGEVLSDAAFLAQILKTEQFAVYRANWND
jgi:SAM-dependent methyltransferase